MATGRRSLIRSIGLTLVLLTWATACYSSHPPEEPRDVGSDAGDSSEVDALYDVDSDAAAGFNNDMITNSSIDKKIVLPPVCGNGITEANETCDGNCPKSCSDRLDCSTDIMLGSPETCDVVCKNIKIIEPIHNDNCCPKDANANTDNDCPSLCGNDIQEPGEICDGTDPPFPAPDACNPTGEELISCTADCQNFDTYFCP